MRLAFTDDQLAIRDALERLFTDAAQAANLTSARERAWDDLTAMGWLSLGVPEARGGAGGGPLEVGLLMRAAGRQALVTPFFPSIVLGGAALAATPAGEIANAILAAALAGETQLAFAHGEGEAYDPPSLRTTACASAGGWRLAGDKAFVQGGGDAGYLVVSAAIDGEPALFLVPADAPGVIIARTGSLRGEEYAAIGLAADLPADALLQRGPPAAALASRVIDDAVMALCWETIGAMSALAERTTDYVKVRQQFGRPIAAFQAVQHRLAEMAVCCEEAQSIVELASLKAGTPDRGRFVCAAKVGVGRAAKFVAETAVQLHGGVGVTEELPVARYFRLLLAFQGMLGSVDRRLADYAALAIPTRTHAGSAVLG
jgi:alkylation response protein AidB-like acyl-CoA dehydrogenase